MIRPVCGGQAARLTEGQVAIRMAINGFGRIGRLALRAAMQRADLEVVAINDLSDPDILYYLFGSDSVHGRYPGSVTREGDIMKVDGRGFPLLRVKDPAELPWKKYGVDVVLECTGAFRARKDCARHVASGARKVIISAPSDDADFTLVMGVNHDRYDPAGHTVISNASCTTNALAPLAWVLHTNFGLERGFALTVHAYTSSQALVDTPHRKRRRSRAAALNLVPTTTGAAAAVGRVMPEMAGRLDGLAVRAPNADGSIVDLTAILSRAATVDEINRAFADAAGGRLEGVLRYQAEDGLVSSDILGDPATSVFDAPLTMAQGNLVKVFGWYDNEYGYASRLLDAAKLVGAIPT